MSSILGSAGYGGGPRILYLHGFRSSPKSFKAQWLAQRLRELGQHARFHCPQLPPSPRESIELIRYQLDLQPADTIIGSSLGGYYATWLAEHYGCRAVLLNPAVRPADRLAAQIGTQRMWHSDEPFEFTMEHVHELRDLQTHVITFPQRYFLVAAKGDELLDWRDMVALYPGARHKVLEGSDHGLSDFGDYGDEVLRFAGVNVPG